MSDVQLKNTTADVIIPLRAKVLRPGLPLEKSGYPQDSLDTTFHICALVNQNVASCGTFVSAVTGFFPNAKNPYQLRGMATDPKYQGQKLGQKIIQEGEKILKEKKSELLWMNARVSAIPFYEKCGYQQIGEVFDIPDVGPHIIMFRHLS